VMRGYFDCATWGVLREDDVPNGRYRIDGTASVRDVSTVFLARDLRLDRKVLLEIFHPEGFGSAEEVARFTRRTRADGQLESEHVRRILDVGIWESGSPYVASEFLEGRDLAEWLRHRGAIPESQAVDFVIQACDALAEAHSLGIVHRDIKPSNIFALERPGVETSIKILGWDASWKLESEATKQKSADSQPEGGTVEARALVGTPLYMPPEQCEGAPDLDVRADIWALGVTLCELVTGHVPFEGRTLPQLYSAMTACQPLRLRERFPPLSAGLEAVILKCLQRERANRFPNVAELAVALLEFGSERSKPLVDRICSITKQDTPMMTSARIQSLYASEKTRLAATGEDTHKTILQGLRTLVHLELRSHHGADGADPRVWEQAAVAIRAAGLWRDPGVPLGSRPKVTPTPGPTPYRCPFVTPGLAVPDDFPAGPFEGTYLHALDDIIYLEQFTGAWHGMAYRFKAAAENAAAFAELFRAHGSNPPSFEPRYAQDREMFEFHANGYGALDCLFYGMYFVAELVKPADFDVSVLLKITAQETTRLFDKHFIGDPLTVALHDTFFSQDYADWGELRNILAHRIASGRIVYMSMQGATTPPPPNRWTSARPAPAKLGYSARTLPSLEITEKALVPRRAWLAGRMDAVLSAAHEFAAKHL